MSRSTKGKQRVNRLSRRFVATSVIFLVVWELSVLLDAVAELDTIISFELLNERGRIYLGVLGFVFHMIFGKAYTLVPSYFDRDLYFTVAPSIHYPLSLFGVIFLVGSGFELGVSELLGFLGATLWLLGVVVFLVTIIATIRDNITGSETGTSDANIERKNVDRYANLFMPIAFVYLGWGSYELFSMNSQKYFELPSLVFSYPGVTHLFVAGVATLLVLSIGFRLFPRFLVAHPPRPLVFVALPAGAIAPALLSTHLLGGTEFVIGASLEALAVLGFAGSYAYLFLKTDRDRVGFYGVLVACGAGFLGILIGLHFAFGGYTPDLRNIHARLNLLGFLGLTIIGAAYQFYPPKVGSFRGANDRSALLSILLIGTGLGLEALSEISLEVIETLGVFLTLIGSFLYAYILLGLFYERR